MSRVEKMYVFEMTAFKSSFHDDEGVDDTYQIRGQFCTRRHRTLHCRSLERNLVIGSLMTPTIAGFGSPFPRLTLLQYFIG
jgi:hypothetical protein